MTDLEMMELKRRSGNVHTDDPLVAFLYDLMRDHVPVGVVERLVQENAGITCDVEYTNGHLARYAMDVARRLKGEEEKPAEFPHSE